MSAYTKKDKSMSVEASNDPLRTLGGRIKAARQAKGLRAGKTASHLGVSRTSFSQWESDAVKNPDIHKLGKFVELVDVNLDWLIERKGDDPDLTPAKTKRRATAMTQQTVLVDGSVLANEPISIPEINAAMTMHANGLDLTPRAYWSIPEPVLDIAFNAAAPNVVMKRVISRNSPALGLSRGDYVLIDTSRTRLDEPGVYIVGDPDGLSARRALVVESEGRLVVSIIDDDLSRSCPQPTVDNLAAFGRVMGIFKAV